MKRYWDYPENERAKLSPQQIEELLRLELMEHGKLRPEEPKKPAVDEPVMIPGEQIFSIVIADKYAPKAIAHFATREAADIAAKLPFVNVDYDYRIGSSYKYAIPVASLGVSEDLVFNKAVLDQVRPKLTAIKEQQEEYDKQVTAYKDSIKEAEAICSTVWEDWHKRLREVSNAKRIVEVFRQYTADCDGCQDIAWRFLLKAFSEKDARKAFEIEAVELPASALLANNSPEPVPVAAVHDVADLPL